MVCDRNVIISLLMVASATTASTEPPRILWQDKIVEDAGAAGGGRTSFAIMRMPGGSFTFYDRNRPQDGQLTLPDSEGIAYTLLPALPKDIANSKTIVASGVLDNAQVILTPDRSVVSIYVKGEKLDQATAKKVGLPRYLNVWAQRATPIDSSEPQMVWRGYNGSQMEYQQLPGGRILVPYGSFQPHARAVPPNGRHKTIIQFSDDGGQTWQESESKLVAPCYANFNGSNEGACEPAIERLSDGRIWMLMRTQAGFLYESYSADNGTTWEPAAASRFHTSTGPANIMRHQNGWLVVCWNNCEMPPRHQGQGVYGGRDALHIAISDDDGRTWRGFREIYLDHRRNGNPASSGDRGTAYPLGAFTADGQIVVLAGQGQGGRNPIVIDPDWIIESKASDDFSDGLHQWSVYKHHGPAKRWWRARAVGCKLVTNPTDPEARSLRVRKPDELPADGATWNFPNGWKGSITAQMMVQAGGQGGVICLNDRMFDPSNDFGERLAVFRCKIEPNGRLGNAMLQLGKWHDVRLDWDLSDLKCELSVDGKLAGQLPLLNQTLNGINYIRFRAAAKRVDTVGILVDSVSASIQDPFAPPCSPADQAEQEQRYIRKVVSQWR